MGARGRQDDRHRGQPDPRELRAHLRLEERAAAVDPRRVPGRAGAARTRRALRQHPGAEQECAEDFALRDRVLEQDLLSSFRAGDDDPGSPVRPLPAPPGRRRFPHLRRHHDRARVLPARTAVLEPRSAQRLAADLFRGVPARVLHRDRDRDDVVDRTAVAKIRDGPRFSSETREKSVSRHPLQTPGDRRKPWSVPDFRRRFSADRRACYAPAAGATLAYLCWRSPLTRNDTVPSTSANSVWSLPTPTFSPGWISVPRWRTMMPPARMTSPP